ncbi:MAG: MBL fold metallo-hydrolase [Defluviitaleaceae bacterium]|nr:MBL fold metallo-hydrolase [Defluviitaleaceae bacterium]
MRKRIFAILLCLLFVFTSCGKNTECFICPECPRCGYPEEHQPQGRPELAGGLMDVFVFGIGRSDAILITTENHAILIDTGENQHGDPIAGTLLSRGITSLDYLIITHFDRDHVGGAHRIINFLDVQNIVVPNYSRLTRHVQRFESAMENAGIEPIVLTEPMSFVLDGAHFVIDPSDLPYMSIDVEDIEDEYDDFEEEDDDDDDAEFIATGDDFSLIVKIGHGRNDFLFMGDATTHRRQQLLDCDDFMAMEFDFIKVGRHGRWDRRTNRFVNHIATNAKYAVVTGFCPSEADIYYPERPTDDRIIERFQNGGTEMFYTMNSHFRIRSDGRELFLQD